MRLFAFCVIAIMAGLCVFAFKRSPGGCAKLQTDIAADIQNDWPKIHDDLTAIFATKPANGDAASSDGDGSLPSSQTAPASAPSTPPAARPVPSFTETTNYQQALAEARRTDRKVMLHFTGSDWCPYCKALEQEVISTANYSQFAQENFITVTLDFPREAPIDPAIKQQNVSLAQKYGVNGYPTLVLITPEEKELARMTGYAPGSGTQAVIEQFEPFAN